MNAFDILNSFEEYLSFANYKENEIDIEDDIDFCKAYFGDDYENENTLTE